MWYERNRKIVLRFDQPIFAKGKKDENIFMLIRSQDGTYDWINLENGEFNSSMQWVSADEAVECYSESYILYNADLFSIISAEEK
jgi:hypothetical protein